MKSSGTRSSGRQVFSSPREVTTSARHMHGAGMGPAPPSPAAKKIPKWKQNQLRKEAETRERIARAEAEAAAHRAANPVSSGDSWRQSHSGGAPAGGGAGPCDAYHIDLNSAEFGMCKCGFKKAAH